MPRLPGYYGTFGTWPLRPYIPKPLLGCLFCTFDQLVTQSIRFNKFCALFHKSAPTMLFYQYIVKIRWMWSYSASMILFGLHFLYITPHTPIIPFPYALCICFKGSKFHRDALSGSIILISFPVHIYVYIYIHTPLLFPAWHQKLHARHAHPASIIFWFSICFCSPPPPPPLFFGDHGIKIRC
jgi:hypothetical protein